jgi:hypothetical protein
VFLAELFPLARHVNAVQASKHAQPSAQPAYISFPAAVAAHIQESKEFPALAHGRRCSSILETADQKFAHGLALGIQRTWSAANPLGVNTIPAIRAVGVSDGGIFDTLLSLYPLSRPSVDHSQPIAINSPDGLLPVRFYCIVKSAGQEGGFET